MNAAYSDFENDVMRLIDRYAAQGLSEDEIERILQMRIDALRRVAEDSE